VALAVSQGMEAAVLHKSPLVVAPASNVELVIMRAGTHFQLHPLRNEFFLLTSTKVCYSHV